MLQHGPMRSVIPPPPARSSGEAIDIIRSFNRRYTRQLGLLDNGLLGSEFTLTEARVLYELANCEDSTATQIAGELGLDLGYMSRLIKKFGRRRYIKRKRSPVDARQSRLQLTERGRAVFDPLDRAARLQIAEMIAPMTPEQHSLLLSAMQSVQRLLEAGSDESRPEPYAIRSLKVGDIGWVAHRQGFFFWEACGWGAPFVAV